MTLHRVATQHDGRFCESPACPVCDLFARPGETFEQCVARLKRQFGHLGSEPYDTERRSLAARKRRAS